MKPYKLYILDLDGTLYRGEEPIPHAADTVRELRNHGAMIRFLTNNSGQTKQFYKAKLQRLGFEAAGEEIFSSAMGAVKVCKEKGYDRIFYVGEPGLRDTFLEMGLNVLNKDDVASGQASAVVAGICRSISYRWLSSALQQIIGGAVFLATNSDATYPIAGGRVEPGAGAIVSAIQTSSGKTPLVIGKPNPYLIEMLLKETGISASETLVVGDRYETDIQSGNNAGVDTHLVLTGVSHEAPPGQSWSQDLSGLL